MRCLELAVEAARDLPLFLSFCSLPVPPLISHYIYMSKKNGLGIIFIFALVACILPLKAWAIPYTVGDYTIDVEVRNTVMNLVPDPYVECWRSGENTIKVEAHAVGYKKIVKKVNITDQQFFYKTDIVLPDLYRSIVIIDINRQIIESAYARVDQYGFSGDRFGMTIFIPVEDWPVPSSEKVEVLEPFWGLPFKKTCEIQTIEQFYQVKLSISRDALEWCSGDLVVLFKNKVEKDLHIAQARLKNLNNLNQSKNYQAEIRLAKFIASSYQFDELKSLKKDLPDSLVSLYECKNKFNKLHDKNFRKMVANF
jgi:hypothetical protein